MEGVPPRLSPTKAGGVMVKERKKMDTMVLAEFKQKDLKKKELDMKLKRKEKK